MKGIFVYVLLFAEAGAASRHWSSKVASADANSQQRPALLPVPRFIQHPFFKPQHLTCKMHRTRELLSDLSRLVSSVSRETPMNSNWAQNKRLRGFLIIIGDEESRDILKLDILIENVVSLWISTIFLELSEFWCSEAKSRRVWNVENDSNSFALVQVDTHAVEQRR